MVLLGGGTKASQRKDFEQAKMLLVEYKNRKKSTGEGKR